MFTNERPVETPENTMPGTLAKKTQFKGFTYENEGIAAIKAASGQ